MPIFIVFLSILCHVSVYVFVSIIIIIILEFVLSWTERARCVVLSLAPVYVVLPYVLVLICVLYVLYQCCYVCMCWTSLSLISSHLISSHTFLYQTHTHTHTQTHTYIHTRTHTHTHITCTHSKRLLARLMNCCKDSDPSTRKFACFALGNAAFHSDLWVIVDMYISVYMMYDVWCMMYDVWCCVLCNSCIVLRNLYSKDAHTHIYTHTY